MKKILLSVSLISTFSFGQECKFSEMKNVSERGKCTTYEGSDGFVYKIGDKVTIGIPSSNKTFAFIDLSSGLSIEPLMAKSSGDEVEIKRIAIAGSKRTGYYATLETKGLTAFHHYFIKVEKAIETGELKANGISSDAALSELKKYKDKLDLGLISKEDFDKKKEELSKYIK
jgi:hypothetical protein